MTRLKIRLALSAATAGALVTCLATTASAQPNPFDDYERFVQSEAQPPAAAPPSGPTLKTSQFTWSGGVRSQLSFSRLTFERAGGGEDGSATALLFRLSPALHLFVVDKIQVGISPGLLARSGGNDVGDASTDAGFLIEVTGQYFVRMTQRTAFVPGLGIGGYFGSGTRTIQTFDADGGITKRNKGASTSGLSLALYVGIAYQLDDRLQLRTGLSANAFFGWDAIEDRNGRLRSAATHIGIPIDLFYMF